MRVTGVGDWPARRFSFERFRPVQNFLELFLHPVAEQQGRIFASLGNAAGGDGSDVVFHRANEPTAAAAGTGGGGAGRNLVQSGRFNELERIETCLDVDEGIFFGLFSFWPRKKVNKVDDEKLFKRHLTTVLPFQDGMLI